jgi:hypothetical protein
VVGRFSFALESFGTPRHSSHVAQLFSLGGKTRTMIFRIALLAVLLMCSGCLPLQDDGTPHLAGSVLDAATKHPIVGAKLHYAEFPKHEVYTGVDGHFDFPSISYWWWNVIFVDSDGHTHCSVLTIQAQDYMPTNVQTVSWPPLTNELFYLNHQ